MRDQVAVGIRPHRRNRLLGRRGFRWLAGLSAVTGLLAAGAVQASAMQAGVGAAFHTPTWSRQIAQPGHAFVYPFLMSYDPTDGTLVVGDYNNYNIKRFSTSGTLLGTYSSKGNGPGQLSGQPYGVAVDPNDGHFDVAVLGVGFMMFSHNGTWIGNASQGAGYTPFIAINSKGTVYLVDSIGINKTAPNVVMIYSSNGTYQTQFGTNGSSCAKGQFGLIRGIDVDSADNIYVDDVANRCIQVFSPTGTFLRYFGNSTELSNNTRGLSVDKANNLVYVADSAKQTVEVFTTSGTFLGTIGTPGSEDGQLGGPREAVADSAGNVYVSDYTYWRINKYYPLGGATSGQFQYAIPNPPQPPPGGGINMANGIAVSPVDGSVYVSDTFNQRVQKFDSSGNFVTMWGSRLPVLSAPYALDYPRGVSVDPNNGNVWVKDTRSGYIKEYDSSGTYISEFGGQGSNPGQFFYAVGITVGPDGTLYIPDSANGRFQVTDQSGTVKHVFPCGIVNGPPNGFVGCVSAALDPSGNIYTSSVAENRVDVFSPTGTLLRTITHTGMKNPYGVAIYGSTLYVVEAGNSRVDAFDWSSGTFLGSWGSKGSAHGQFNRPLGIAVDTSGNIYVNDFGNDRIEVFAP